MNKRINDMDMIIGLSIPESCYYFCKKTRTKLFCIILIAWMNIFIMLYKIEYVHPIKSFGV